MARGVNKVILVGNIGQDPEVRHTQGGSTITNVSLATSESWKDKQTGQKQEKTEWHRVVFFNRLAEVAAEYIRKGSKIYVEGKLQTSKWKGQNGEDRYTTEIIANEMQLLDSRQGGQQSPQQPGPDYPPQQQPYQQPQQPYQQPPQQAPNYPPQQAPQPPVDPMSFDDDIPF